MQSGNGEMWLEMGQGTLFFSFLDTYNLLKYSIHKEK